MERSSDVSGESGPAGDAVVFLTPRIFVVSENHLRYEIVCRDDRPTHKFHRRSVGLMRIASMHADV